MARLLFPFVIFALALPCVAQVPALRLIPESSLESHKVYLEVALSPCRVQEAQVSSPTESERAIVISTHACVPGGLDTEAYVVPLGLFPAGTARLSVTIDGTSRGVTFLVAPRVYPGDETLYSPIITGDVRVDRSISIPLYCGQQVGSFINDSRTEIVANIELAPGAICPAVPTPVLPARIGFPHAGHHVVLLYYAYLGRLLQTQLVVAGKALEKLDYSDLWDVEGESGWGVTIRQHDKDRMFAVLYGYRSDGTPLWLSLQLPGWDTATRVSGDLLVARGTPQSGPFDATRTGAYPVARGTLEFLSLETATLTMESYGASSELGIPIKRSWPLRRLRF